MIDFDILYINIHPISIRRIAKLKDKLYRYDYVMERYKWSVQPNFDCFQMFLSYLKKSKMSAPFVSEKNQIISNFSFKKKYN